MSALLAALSTEPSAGAQFVRSAVGLAVCGLSARRGYLKAEAAERETGSLPRNWSPTTWSAICFASLLIGHVWLSTAARSTIASPRTPASPPPLPDAPDPRFSWGTDSAPAPVWARPTPAAEAPVEEPPPPAPAPQPVPLPAVVQAPPKPFSMNPRPVWPAEAPAAAVVPPQPLPGPVVPLREPVAPEPALVVPAPVEVVAEAAEPLLVAPVPVEVVAEAAEPVVDSAPDAVLPVQALPETPEVEPAPAPWVGVASMDVLPAFSGKKRR